MILPDLQLPSRVNQCWIYSGIDSPRLCMNKKHFESYPHSVEYVYNSRGFRDQEWPSTLDELKNSVWCVGDSFTVGIGAPAAHAWPARLKQIIHRSVINVSMDGASNNWIARITKKIIAEIDPEHIVIMWSFVSRRESDDLTLDDEQRRQHVDSKYNFVNPNGDWENFLHCQQQVKHRSTEIQFAIPGFDLGRNINLYESWKNIAGPDWPPVPESLTELYALPEWILQELQDTRGISLQSMIQELSRTVQRVNQLDFARDGFHFDLITADWVAARVADRLQQ